MTSETSKVGRMRETVGSGFMSGDAASVNAGVHRTVRYMALSALVCVGMVAAESNAEEIVFKPGDTGTSSAYRYYPMNESSKKAWWVNEACLDNHVGADVTFWGEQDAGVYPNYLKRAESNWLKNVGAVKGDNTWIWEYFVPTDSPGSLEIGDAGSFYGWWRFLKPITLKYPRATGTVTPVMQRVESIGRVNFQVAAADGHVIVSNLVGSGVVQKSGAGELEIVRTGGGFVNVAHHAGKLTLHEQEDGASTTFESVLARAKVRFDASDRTKFTFDDQGKVVRWGASAPNVQYYAQPVTTNKYTMGSPMFTNKYKWEVLPVPTYREKYSPTGLAAVDFGPFRKYDAADADTCGAAALEFMLSGARVNYVEVFIVVGDTDPQCRCDLFCDSHNRTFPRGTDLINFDDNRNFINLNGGVLKTLAASARTSRDIRVNGRLVPPGFAIAGSNLKVVSIDCKKQGNVQSGESVIGAFARRSNTEFGGQIVAEFIGFDVSLTDAERQAVNRHLMEKWLGAAECDKASVNTVEADSGTAISVPAEERATVNHLYATTKGSTIVKTGAGTLGMVDLNAPGGDRVSIDVREGSVAFVAPSQAIPVEPEIAASPRYHFDASKLDSLTTNVVGTKTFITRWNDVAQADVYAYPVTDEFDLKATTNTPPVPTSPAQPQLEMNKCNGKPVVYLGTRVDMNGIKKAGYGDAGAFLYAKRVDENVETYANVMEGFAVIAGCYCSYTFSTLGRRIFAPSGWNLISARSGMQALTGGAWTINGEPVDPATVKLNQYQGQSLEGKYIVVRFSANERVLIDGVGFDGKATDGVGGLRVGEIVLYDRRLNEAERRDTEASLMRKWLNKDHPYAKGPQVEKLSFADGVTARLETDVDVSVQNLETTSRSFLKTGSGELKAELPQSVTELNVQSGCYEMPLSDDVMSRALIHLDANEADSLEYDEAETSRIVRWRDVRGVDYPCAQSDTAHYLDGPTLKSNAQNELNVVDFGDVTTYGKAEGDKDAFKNYPNPGKALCFDRTLFIREGFLVLKHDDYASILGGVDYTSFHPNKDTLINVNPDVNHSLSCLKRESEWRVDDNEIDIWTYQWSDYRATGTGYHVLSFAITNDYSAVTKQVNCAAVQTLSTDRAHSAGGQKYGEVVLFDVALTPAERVAVRQHLIRKWNTAAVAQRALDSLTLGANASVTLGSSFSVKRFAGDGTVTGDLVLEDDAEIRATYRGPSDFTQTEFTGTLTLPEQASFTLTVDAETKPTAETFVDIFVAKEIVGSCRAWENVSVVDPLGTKYRFRWVKLSVETRADGKKALRATFVANGYAIIVR